MTTTEPSIKYANSIDGTRIGYETLGSGPALVLVQGAMGTAYTFRELAEELADSFTVVVPDRRGRGLSPHRYDDTYTIDDDVHDLDAVLEATGASLVFGLSSGGDITLRAAQTLDRIAKLAVFEPAVLLDGVPAARVRRFERYARTRDLAGLLVTGMKVGQFGPAALRLAPDWLLKAAVKTIMKKEAQAGSGGYAPMAELAEAFRYDFSIVAAMDGSIPSMSSITKPVLLMGGTKSPAYLTRALDKLERTIPNVGRVRIEGDHAVSWNVDPQRNRHGNPKTVAAALKTYFGAPS